MCQITALILAGGEGTRLQPLTLSRPKPVLPVANRPFLHYQLEQFRSAGISRAVIAVSYKSDQISNVIGNSYHGIDISYSVEKEPMGTGGAIALANNGTEGAWIVTNGDVLTDLDLRAFIQEHQRCGYDASILLTCVDDPSRYGVVELDRDNRIEAFVEKPRQGQGTSRWINAGYYLLSSRVVRQIPREKAVSVEREIFPALISEDFRLGGFKHKGYWMDMGTLDSYRQVHRDFLMGSWSWPDGVIPGYVDRKNSNFFEEMICLPPSVTVKDSIFHRNISIGHSSSVINSVVSDNVVIGSSVHLKDEVVAPGTHIADQTGMEEPDGH